ncbi:MAG: hypothetical protein NDI94_01875 [Candidatus Woesearchaeota archaeon]|nr:hypothetical protein [Candidatus Woesearchaeota archaeon]
MLIKPEAILRYLKGEEKLHTLITTQNDMVQLITTDQYLYEALGSVENRNEIDMNLLVKFLEVTKIVPHEDMTKEARKILTHERVDELRKPA